MYSSEDKKNVIEELKKSMGIVTMACNKTGIARTTFYEWLKEDEEFKRQVNEVSEIAIDFVESQLYKQIKDGEVASTIFYLKSKAKHRGYVERTEVDSRISFDTETLRIRKIIDNELNLLSEPVPTPKD